MKRENISGLPVVVDDKLVGIISRRDIKPIVNSKGDKKVKEVMTSDVVTVPESITPEEALNIAYENKVERLPVVKDGKLVGIITVRDILERKKYPNACRDEEGRFLVAAAVGPFDLDRAKSLDKAGADILVIDSAHAHNMRLVKYSKIMKKILMLI